MVSDHYRCNSQNDRIFSIALKLDICHQDLVNEVIIRFKFSLLEGTLRHRYVYTKDHKSLTAMDGLFENVVKPFEKVR